MYSSACYSECPSGTYKDVTDCTCKDCTAGCETCYGSGLNKCYSCTNTTTPANTYYKKYNRDSCTTDCGNYYYGVTELNRC